MVLAGQATVSLPPAGSTVRGVSVAMPLMSGQSSYQSGGLCARAARMLSWREQACARAWPAPTRPPLTHHTRSVKMPTPSNRRQFLKASAATAAGIVILKDSRSAAAYPANEKLSIGIIGACGQGGSNAKNVASENLVALCDVDERRADETHKKFPQAKRYVDFRKMLDELHRQARCRGGQHARPHPRRGCDRGHEAGQARLLRKAADADGSRVPA